MDKKKRLIYGIIFIQTVISAVWMIFNITAIPIFGDSQEYLELSKTLQLDEYRPILYPLILRGIQKFSTLCRIPYQIILYVIQTAVSFASSFFLINKLVKKSYDTKEKIILSLGILTIPIVTIMNFSVLTDSFANSLLLVQIALLISFMKSRQFAKVYHPVLLAMSMIGQGLLRADRLYSTVVLTIVVLICTFWKQRAEKTVLLRIALMVALCIISVGFTKFVDSKTQVAGRNGRVATSMEFVLLDRIAWPNMVETYEAFPESIKAIISPEDAQVFDEHNNNVMYQMAPLIENAVGKKEAKDVYRQIAEITFKEHPVKVVAQIAEDSMAMIFTPFSSLLSKFDLCQKADAWNTQCASTKTPQLMTIYNWYYLIVITILMILWVVSRYKDELPPKDRKKNDLEKNIRPMFYMSLILTLWFSLGDGAPPNDRYAMIIYIWWSILIIGNLFVSSHTIENKEE